LLEEQLAQEASKAKAWLVDTHRDIQRNFDPSVVKLRKKCQIIMSEGAMEDLRRIGADD
jgi:hypothetical protein